jgi:small subunit ribosomal protein S6
VTQAIYEILYIINPTLGETEIDEVHARVISTIESNGGNVRRESKWGNRRLAYEVKNFREGFYALVEFNGTGDTVRTLKELLRVESRVIRQLITRVPKAKLAEEARKERVAAKKAEEERQKAEEEAKARAAAEEEAKAKAAAEAAEEETKEEPLGEVESAPESSESTEESTKKEEGSES